MQFATVSNGTTRSILFRATGRAAFLQALAYIRRLARNGVDVAGLEATAFAVSNYIAARGVTLYTPVSRRSF